MRNSLDGRQNGMVMVAMNIAWAHSHQTAQAVEIGSRYVIVTSQNFLVCIKPLRKPGYVLSIIVYVQLCIPEVLYQLLRFAGWLRRTIAESKFTHAHTN